MRSPDLPVPGIWRFHLIYLVVALGMAWAAFPRQLYASMLVVALSCLIGLVLVYWNMELATHALALAIGIAMPIVIVGGLMPGQTILLFAGLIGAIFASHRTLF